MLHAIDQRNAEARKRAYGTTGIKGIRIRQNCRPDKTASVVIRDGNEYMKFEMVDYAKAVEFVGLLGEALRRCSIEIAVMD